MRGTSVGRCYQYKRKLCFITQRNMLPIRIAEPFKQDSALWSANLVWRRYSKALCPTRRIEICLRPMVDHIKTLHMRMSGDSITQRRVLLEYSVHPSCH